MVIDDFKLTEIDLVGKEFIWVKSKGSPNWVRERLDGVFANDFGGGNVLFVSCLLPILLSHITTQAS